MIILIADQIRRLRTAKSFSQDYMADKLGITQQAYSKIENHVSEASLSRLQQIAQILEVPLPLLLGIETELVNLKEDLTEGERKLFHEIIVNQQRIIEKQEETIRAISASLVLMQTGGGVLGRIEG